MRSILMLALLITGLAGAFLPAAFSTWARMIEDYNQAAQVYDDTMQRLTAEREALVEVLVTDDHMDREEAEHIALSAMCRKMPEPP